MSHPVGCLVAEGVCFPRGCVYCKIVWGNAGDDSFWSLLEPHLNRSGEQKWDC